MLRTQEARTAREVGITHHDIRRRAIHNFASLVRYHRADGGIDDRATRWPTGVHPIGGRGMFVDDIVVHRTQQREMLHQTCALFEMFANLHAGNAGVDGVVIRTRFLEFGVAFAFGIPRIHVARAATEPNENTMLGFALREFLWSRQGIGQQGRAHGGGG